jgi:hypothetical protein
MHAEKSNFTLARMARLLQVLRLGYYAWLDRAPSPGAIGRERIDQKISWFNGESDEVSGSPRILADLRADGEIISRKSVVAAMRWLGLRGICPRCRSLDRGPLQPPQATFSPGQISPVQFGMHHCAHTAADQQAA